jgi:SNF2 family DNA or RNA helicase
MDSWKDDVLLHSDLEPWLINVEDIEEKWERLAEPQGDLTLCDMQGLHWALSKRKPAKKGFTLVPDEKRITHVKKLYNWIGIDESHKLANHQSLWFKLLRRLTEDADFVYATTGTLFGRDLEDIWPQFYLVDRGETFGENLGLFRASFFTAKQNPWGRGEKYEYDKRQDKELNRMLQHRSLRYDEDEVTDLPTRVSRIEQFRMSPEQWEHYLRALEGMINCRGSIEEMEGQWCRMRMIISGYLAWNDEAGSHAVRFKENPKLDGLERLLDEMGDRAKAIVCYDYTETGRMITERVEKMGLGFEWFYGGTKDKTKSRERFMNDPKCRVFVMNSATGGTGTDGLQKVARYMFLYETPTSPTERKQTIKRIHRPGQTMRTFIYDMVMKKSLDAGILMDLQANLDTYDSVVKGKRKPGRGFFLQDLPTGPNLDIV